MECKFSLRVTIQKDKNYSTWIYDLLLFFGDRFVNTSEIHVLLQGLWHPADCGVAEMNAVELSRSEWRDLCTAILQEEGIGERGGNAEKKIFHFI